MAKVLLLEDEDDLRHEVADFLSSEGHQVLEASSVAEFKLLVSQAEIAIIDVGLPDGDGFDVAAQLRQSHPHVGTLILTARGSIDDKIDGLKRGADHYLIKPVRLSELSAYVTATARRIARNVWKLSLIERRLSAPNGASEVLSALEMTLVELLARNAGRVVLRPDIAKAFGTDWLDYDERHLDQLVSRLRRRWQKNTGDKLPLQTEHGQGYSLLVDIEVA